MPMYPQTHDGSMFTHPLVAALEEDDWFAPTTNGVQPSPPPKHVELSGGRKRRSSSSHSSFDSNSGRKSRQPATYESIILNSKNGYSNKHLTAVNIELMKQARLKQELTEFHSNDKCTHNREKFEAMMQFKTIY